MPLIFDSILINKQVYATVKTKVWFSDKRHIVTATLIEMTKARFLRHCFESKTTPFEIKNVHNHFFHKSTF